MNAETYIQNAVTWRSWKIFIDILTRVTSLLYCLEFNYFFLFNSHRQQQITNWKSIDQSLLIWSKIKMLKLVTFTRLDNSRRLHGFCSIKYTGNDITSQTKAKALMAPIAVCTQKLSILKKLCKNTRLIIMQSTLCCEDEI